MRLGWSHGDQEIFSLEELVRLFDIQDVNKAASAFNPEKLLWVNQQHMMRAPLPYLAGVLREQLQRLGIETQDQALLEGIVAGQRERSKTMKEMAESQPLFLRARDVVIDEKAGRKHLGRGGCGDARAPAHRLWVAHRLVRDRRPWRADGHRRANRAWAWAKWRSRCAWR